MPFDHHLGDAISNRRDPQRAHPAIALRYVQHDRGCEPAHRHSHLPSALSAATSPYDLLQGQLASTASRSYILALLGIGANAGFCRMDSGFSYLDCNAPEPLVGLEGTGSIRRPQSGRSVITLTTVTEVIGRSALFPAGETGASIPGGD